MNVCECKKSMDPRFGHDQELQVYEWNLTRWGFFPLLLSSIYLDESC